MLISNYKDINEIQPKVFTLLKSIVTKVKLPALAHITDVVLQTTEQETTSAIRTTYICNILMALFDYIKSQSLTKDEEERKMAEKSIENCFKAFSNLLSRKQKIKYSFEIQKYLCANQELYFKNSQFYLRGLHLLYKVFMNSKNWLEDQNVVNAIPFLLETLQRYHKVLEKEPKCLEIPQRNLVEKRLQNSQIENDDIKVDLIGYFFESKDENPFTEYDAQSLVLTYVIALIALLSKNKHCAVALPQSDSFGLILNFLKLYGGALRVQNAKDVIKALRRVFTQGETLARLTALDVGTKIIDLGKISKPYNIIMIWVCRYLKSMSKFNAYQPYFRTCGVISYLRNILDEFGPDSNIYADADEALKNYEENSNIIIQLLGEHKVSQFIKAIPVTMKPDELFGYVKYLKMMLVQGFIEVSEIDKNAITALLEFTSSFLQTEVKNFKENIYKELLAIYDFLLPKNPEYAGILLHKEISEIILGIVQQNPCLLGEACVFIKLLTTQSPDGVIPYLNQEKLIDEFAALQINLSNCNSDDALHVFEMLNNWFDYSQYYVLYFSQDILKLLNNIAFNEHLKLTKPLKCFTSLIKKVVANGTILDPAVSTLSFDLFKRLINSEDSSIQLSGIYPFHILSQYKQALKYIDVETVEKLVICAQSPISEVRILSISALANILENCHSPLLVVFQQSWAFLNTIAKLLDSSSLIEKSLALRSIFLGQITKIGFALLPFDIWKAWNPLILKYEKAKNYIDQAGVGETVKIKEPIGKPDITFEDICQGYISAIWYFFACRKFIKALGIHNYSFWL